MGFSVPHGRRVCHPDLNIENLIGGAATAGCSGYCGVPPSASFSRAPAKQP